MRTLLCLLAFVATAHADPVARVRSLVWSADRAPDRKKYPSPVQERYELDADGKLHYSAYFGNMPSEMNHNDAVNWKSGDDGKELLALAAQLVADPQSGLRRLRDDKQAPAGSITVEITTKNADSTLVVTDHARRAWIELDAGWQKLIAQFERATHRPKKPSQLPQNSTP